MRDQRAAATRITLIAAWLVMLAACGGGGGGGGGATTTTVSGKITFDRVPVGSNGLNFAGITQSPARGVVVQAIRGTSATGTSLASTVTDASGNYTLTVPVNTQMIIRADAQMVQTGSGATWNFRVLNNANGNSLYVLTSPQPFDSGGSPSTHNLNAASGWNGSAYVDANRAAAPFAILDTIFQAKGLLLAAQASLAFPALDVYWSTKNIPNTPQYCPTDGRIGTTAYIAQASSNTNCSVSTTVLPGMYVLGSASGDDTDEFDQHVIAHEFGHYVEDKIVDRADSIGGKHGAQSLLDPRVAFGEGWGNAFSAMVLGDPAYKDTVLSGSTNGFNVENGTVAVRGWYSEASVGQIIWDIFDSQDESGDTVHVGFGPILTALRGPNKDSDALGTIYSFDAALRSQNSSSSQGISDLEFAHNIQGRGAFVEQNPETNNGGDLDALPLYTPIDLNSQTAAPLCTDARNGQYNRLNNRRFLTLSLGAPATVTVTVFAGLNMQDPDLLLLRRGQRIASATATGQTDSIQNIQLAAGSYVIEVFDFAYADPNNANVQDTSSTTRHCFTLSVTGQ